MNSSSWASTIAEGPQTEPGTQASSHQTSRPGPHDYRISPFSPSPPPQSEEVFRSDNRDDHYSARAHSGQPRRRNSVVLSSDPDEDTWDAPRYPVGTVESDSAALGWSESPTRIPSHDRLIESTGSIAAGAGGSRITGNGHASGSNNNVHGAERVRRARVLFDGSHGSGGGTDTPQRYENHARSTPRRSQQQDTTPNQQDSHGTLNSEMRTTLAAERLRIQRQAAVEESHRLSQWEQQYRRLANNDYSRSPRWIRSALGEDIVTRGRDYSDDVGTAGIGWGEDGRTL